jgi:hypothetical protein
VRDLVGIPAAHSVSVGAFVLRGYETEDGSLLYNVPVQHSERSALQKLLIGAAILDGFI